MKSFSFEVTASVSAVIWRVVHENPTEIMVPPPFLHVFPVDWQGGCSATLVYPRGRVVPATILHHEQCLGMSHQEFTCISNIRIYIYMICCYTPFSFSR